jgi:hypothetical protein
VRLYTWIGFILHYLIDARDVKDASDLSIWRRGSWMELVVMRGVGAVVWVLSLHYLNVRLLLTP